MRVGQNCARSGCRAKSVKPMSMTRHSKTISNRFTIPLCCAWARLPDLANPPTYTELMRSLWLTHPNPLWPGVADKIAMRDYVAAHDISIPPLDVLAVHEDATQLDLASLPDEAMLKINNGCNMNLLHTRQQPITPATLSQVPSKSLASGALAPLWRAALSRCAAQVADRRGFVARRQDHRDQHLLRHG